MDACTSDDSLVIVPKLDLMEVPRGMPSIIFPPDNAFSVDRWKLGKKLFYDTRLSKDKTISCASCHKQDLAFSDDVPFSTGVDGQIGTRNSPSLANVAYHPYFTREGGVPTLEMQVLVPIQEHKEFNNNIVLIADELKNDSTYVRLSMSAYNQEPNSFVITRALANFERSLISGLSLYDLYHYYNQEKAMTTSALKGMELFMSSKTQCSSCHSGSNFTNYSFKNNGLYTEYMDIGRARLTGDTADIALFKVPSLRNVSLTSPYMHDGSLTSIDDVIDHYDKGGYSHRHKSKLLKKLNLSIAEKQDLKSFLESLTDNTFIDNPDFNYK